jgi:hypothetical protein
MDISFQILLEELLLQRITNMYPLHLAPKTLSMVTKELVHLNDQNNLFDHGIKTYSNKMNCELMLTYDTSAYMFNVYKNQISQQTGSKNLTGLNTLPTIWHTYMKLVTKYQISAINCC